jgi:hypothetical protein
VKAARTLAAAAVASGLLAGPVLACGDEWMGVNLVATPGVKAALRSAYLAAHPGLSSSRVGGPAPGRTYYGSYSGTRYAVATFGAYPTIFRTDQHGRWRVRRETHGGICTNVVPLDLIVVWSLEHWGGRCFVEPRR